MPKYDVDVKVFIAVKVRADTEEDARLAAEAFVESALVVDPNFVRGYNEGLSKNATAFVVPKEYAPDIDGESVVEEEGL